MNKQAIKDNAQHVAGVLIGLTLLKTTGLRYGKEHRGQHWYSHVAANLAADGFVQWFPYSMKNQYQGIQ